MAETTIWRLPHLGFILKALYTTRWPNSAKSRRTTAFAPDFASWPQRDSFRLVTVELYRPLRVLCSCTSKRSAMLAPQCRLSWPETTPRIEIQAGSNSCMLNSRGVCPSYGLVDGHTHTTACHREPKACLQHLWLRPLCGECHPSASTKRCQYIEALTSDFHKYALNEALTEGTRMASATAHLIRLSPSALSSYVTRPVHFAASGVVYEAGRNWCRH